MRKITSLIALILCTQLFVGCTSSNDEPMQDIASMSWEEIVDFADGSTVYFYGFGGDQNVNEWIDTTLAEEVKEKYNIKLERVPMIPSEYLGKLLSEKQLDSAGTMDIVWINGENFGNAKEQELLYGPMTNILPNYNTYLDATSPDILYDYGQEIEGLEAPFGKAQLVFIGDSAKLEAFPKNHEELLELAKKYPGQITYPEVTDFTGGAFVRNIIYDIVGYETFLDIEPTKEAVKTAVQPAMDYLKELKPYLWREGETYPATLAQLDNMYADGEVLLTMNYAPFNVEANIQDGIFSQTSKSFVFENGTMGDTHFLAVPFNAPNKAAALVVINEILSPEMQVTKYDPKVWGDLPVTDPELLSEEQKQLFDAVDIGDSVIPQDELLNKRLPEMSAKLVPIIQEIWREEILSNE